MRATAALLLAAGLVAAAACSDDDDGQGGNTTGVTELPPTTTGTTSVATTSAPATTAPPPTTDPPTTSAPPTTSTPPTTEPVDEEALKAQIADDYERAFYRRWQMLENPRLRNLEARAAEVAVVRFARVRRVRVDGSRELVALGDAVVPNDPDLLAVTVESVELVGEPPYRRAISHGVRGRPTESR